MNILKTFTAATLMVLTQSSFAAQNTHFLCKVKVPKNKTKVKELKESNIEIKINLQRDDSKEIELYSAYSTDEKRHKEKVVILEKDLDKKKESLKGRVDLAVDQISKSINITSSKVANSNVLVFSLGTGNQYRLTLRGNGKMRANFGLYTTASFEGKKDYTTRKAFSVMFSCQTMTADDIKIYNRIKKEEATFIQE
jgi:hypothetical protein